jgi:hypothetical protein
MRFKTALAVVHVHVARHSERVRLELDEEGLIPMQVGKWRIACEVNSAVDTGEVIILVDVPLSSCTSSYDWAGQSFGSLYKGSV